VPRNFPLKLSNNLLAPYKALSGEQQSRGIMTAKYIGEENDQIGIWSRRSLISDVAASSSLMRWARQQES